ncbi:hypothetical protein Ddc_12252 [Ditylenchus destructor]|nr:hypothetical protein Ddc_12252 [Ditylenchus destructor]
MSYLMELLAIFVAVSMVMAFPNSVVRDKSVKEINTADNSNLNDSNISFENEIRENNALSIHRRTKRLTFEQQIAIAATASVAGVIVTFTGCFPAVVVVSILQGIVGFYISYDQIMDMVQKTKQKLQGNKKTDGETAKDSVKDNSPTKDNTSNTDQNQPKEPQMNVFFSEPVKEPPRESTEEIISVPIIIKINRTMRERARELTNFLKENLSVTDSPDGKPDKINLSLGSFDTKSHGQQGKWSAFIQTEVGNAITYVTKGIQEHMDKNPKDYETQKNNNSCHANSRMEFQILATVMRLISLARIMFEYVSDLCLEYILLARVHPGYKDVAAPYDICVEDWVQYEWLTQMETIIVNKFPENIRKKILKFYVERHKMTFTRHIRGNTSKHIREIGDWGEKASQIMGMVSALDPHLDNPAYKDGPLPKKTDNPPAVKDAATKDEPWWHFHKWFYNPTQK